jgi:hypothetical protein
MVININKAINYLSSQLIEYIKRPRHMTLEIQVLVWDRHENVEGLNWLMGSQILLLDNWISNGKK